MRLGGKAAVAVVFAVLLVIGACVGAWLLWPVPRTAAPALVGLASTVEQGRYLARAGNCMSCHTAAFGKPYAGGTAFHTPFGLMYSTNITADTQTGIGRWSFDDFYQSMKHGVRPDGSDLYPAFPYTSFSKLSDADIGSLYLFLKTLEPVSAPARENALRFPFDQRFLLKAWKKLFHDPASYQPLAEQTAEWNRGAYLVQGPGHCGACHSPRNVLGAEQQDWAFAGGVYVDEVAPRKYRKWSAVNLTPHAAGLGAWSVSDIVHYLKDGENPRAVVHGPMNEVVMNSTRHLNDSDLRAIAVYLKGIAPQVRGSNRNASEETLAAGEIGYTVHCGSCHLPTGQGDEGLGVSLVGNAIVQVEDPASLINVLLYGPRVPPPPFVSDRTRMKPFGKRLSDQDIADIASFLRASFGNQGSEIRAEQVTRQR